MTSANLIRDHNLTEYHNDLSIEDFSNKSRGKLEGLDFSGVYVFVSPNVFPRLIDKTDILYIGQSGDQSNRSISDRLLEYQRGYESAPQDRRIKKMIVRFLQNGKYLKLFYKQCLKNECKNRESELLVKFFEDHNELPPFNRSGSGALDILLNKRKSQN